jgi:hypothetical protein
MDIENLSYDYLKKFFNKYFDKGDLNGYYLCKQCRTLEQIPLLDQNCFHDNYIQSDKEFDFLTSVEFIERDYIYDNDYCEKDPRFNKEQVQFNEKNLEDLSENEINAIIKKYTNGEHCDSEYFYCNICKMIRVFYYYDDGNIRIKNGVEYSSNCGRCYKIYPECCIDYYQFPLYENEYDICIECHNETNPVNLKPAK